MDEELTKFFVEKSMMFISLRKDFFNDLDSTSRYLKSHIRKTLDLHRYIFNDSFICYYSHSEKMMKEVFSKICNPDEDVYYTAIIDYFMDPLFACYNNNGDINKSRSDYVLLMKDETKKQVIKAWEVGTEITKQYGDYIPRVVDILLCMLAHCFIVGMEQFSDMADKFLTNPLSLVAYLQEKGLDINNVTNGRLFAETIYNFYDKEGPIIS